MVCIWLQRYLFCLLLIPFHDSVPLLETGMLIFTWWPYLMDKLTFLEIQIQQPRELQHPLNSFSPKKKVITQQGSIKETTKTWIPGFQLHTEPKQQQQTKGTGLASALNQGQMQLLQQGWMWGEAGKGAAAGLNAAQPQRQAPCEPEDSSKPSPPLPSPTSINCAGVALPKQCCTQKSLVPELGSVQVGFESGA